MSETSAQRYVCGRPSCQVAWCSVGKDVGLGPARVMSAFLGLPLLLPLQPGRFSWSWDVGILFAANWHL